MPSSSAEFLRRGIFLSWAFTAIPLLASFCWASGVSLLPHSLPAITQLDQWSTLCSSPKREKQMTMNAE
jgi:hypothetical protein